MWYYLVTFLQAVISYSSSIKGCFSFKPVGSDWRLKFMRTLFLKMRSEISRNHAHQSITVVHDMTHESAEMY
ncbi:hypothetical protein BDF21DRAFT_423176 [Thamnidium elegans]|nr:hypothetical protein BDF21DRAFT_423176 [Thamnidium elegans]